MQSMGYTALRSQALSAPPHLAAFIAVLVTAYCSDRACTRSPFVIFHALLAAAGYLLMAICGLLNANAHWRYIGVYPATIGFFSAITIIITWTLNNQHSSTGRGTGLAVLNYIGQVGPLVGVHLYPEEEGPYYVKGMSICAGCMASVAALAIILRIFLTSANQRTSLEKRSSTEEDEGLMVEERKDEGKRLVFII